MSSQVQCPNCSAVYTVRAEVVGRTVKCRCGSIFTLLAPPPAAPPRPCLSPPPPAPLAAAPSLSTLEQAGGQVAFSPLGPVRVRRRRRGRGWLLWVGIAAGILGFAGIIAGVVAWWVTPRGPSWWDQGTPERVFRAQQRAISSGNWKLHRALLSPRALETACYALAEGILECCADDPQVIAVLKERGIDITKAGNNRPNRSGPDWDADEQELMLKMVEKLRSDEALYFSLATSLRRIERSWQQGTTIRRAHSKREFYSSDMADYSKTYVVRPFAYDFSGIGESSRIIDSLIEDETAYVREDAKVEDGPFRLTSVPFRFIDGKWYLDVKEPAPRPFIVKAEEEAKRGVRISNEEGRGRLKIQAEEYGRAIIAGKNERVVALTHPAIVRKLRGTQNAVRVLSNGFAKLKAQGLQFGSISFSEPSELYEAKGAVYGIVPYRMPLTGPGGERGQNVSYMVGISDDLGQNWTFLDASSEAGEESEFHELLPDYPTGLARPPRGGAEFFK